MNFKGQFQPKISIRCERCGRAFGPTQAVKMGYRQYGIAQGNFCSNTCCKLAFDEVLEANPELIEDDKGLQ